MTTSVTTIDARADVITLINLFTTRPERLQAFVDTQISEYERLRGKAPGAMAANLHRGVQGTHAVNYAQFQSVDKYREWIQSKAMEGHLPAIEPLVDRAEPGLYQVRHVRGRHADPAVAYIEPSRSEDSALTLIALFDVAEQDRQALILGQARAAAEIMEAVPEVLAIALHEGVDHGMGADAMGNPKVRFPRHGAVAYIQLRDRGALDRLTGHAAYRAWFTPDQAQPGQASIDQVWSELFTVTYVQNTAS
jgi:Antibiotic biosynthesis monooxygenase